MFQPQNSFSRILLQGKYNLHFANKETDTIGIMYFCQGNKVNEWARTGKL